MNPTPRRRRVRSLRPLLAALALLALPVAATAQTLTTVWPDPEVLDLPEARALDSAGNFYVAGVDSDNLFKIAPDGTVTILASADLGLPASFLAPRSIAVDAADNVYVACGLSHNLFKFTPAGAVSVVADVNGDGVGNTLLQPTTVVALGMDVWVAGFTSNNVFHVSPTGTVTLVMDASALGGGTTLAQARVRSEAGRLFILGSTEVFEVAPGPPGSLITELLGPAGDGMVPFSGATDLCVDTAGKVFAADASTVFSIPPGGPPEVAFPLAFSIGGADIVSDSLGSTWVTHNVFGSTPQLTQLPPDDPPVTLLSDGQTYEGLTADDAGNLYWVRPQAVASDWLIRRAPDGTLSVLIGQLGAGNGNFLLDGEEPLLAPDGSLFVVGRTSDNAMHAGPGFVDLLVSPPDAVVGFPLAVAVDHQGRLLVGDNNSVVRFDLQQDTAEVVFDISGDGLGNQAVNIRGLGVDHAGNVWVAGRSSSNLFRITPSGDVDQVLDSSGAGGQSFFQPFDLVVDAQDNVFVSAQNSHCVFRVEPDGTATPVITSTGDGTHPLNQPQGVAVDGAGNLYVAGVGSDNVFRVSPAGDIVRIADSSVLDNPVGVAASWGGDVYVAGSFSGNVIHIDPSHAVTEILTVDGDGMGKLLARPGPIQVDAFGTVFVGGENSDNVFRVDPDGTISQVLGPSGAGPHAPLDLPLDLALDLSGNVFVAGADSGTVLALSRDDWFTDLGGSSPGSQGRPRLSCKGDLSFPSTQDRVLTHLPPNAFILVWIAFSPTPFDALGGTVHAFPFSQQLLFVADPTGSSELSVPWPAGIPAGIDIYLQFVVQDFGVPAGLTLSNATMQTTP